MGHGCSYRYIYWPPLGMCCPYGKRASGRTPEQVIKIAKAVLGGGGNGMPGRECTLYRRNGGPRQSTVARHFANKLSFIYTDYDC